MNLVYWILIPYFTDRFFPKGMKCQYELDQKRNAKKIPMSDMRHQIAEELDSDPSLREAWAQTMHQRRILPKKRHKTPLLKCMSVESATSSVGAQVRSQYVLPTDEWEAQYGTLLPHKMMCRRITDNCLVEHIVFFSLKPPVHLMNLQDFKSNQLTTTTYVSAEPTPFGAAHSEALRNDGAPSEAAMSTASNSITPSASNRSDIVGSRSAESKSYTWNYLQDESNFAHLGQMSNPQTPNSSNGVESQVKEEPEDEIPLTEARMRAAAVKEERRNR